MMSFVHVVDPSNRAISVMGLLAASAHVEAGAGIGDMCQAVHFIRSVVHATDAQAVLAGLVIDVFGVRLVANIVETRTHAPLYESLRNGVWESEPEGSGWDMFSPTQPEREEGDRLRDCIDALWLQVNGPVSLDLN